MNISELRQGYHNSLCKEVIRIRRQDNCPNFADDNSDLSKQYAWGIVKRIGCTENFEKIEVQVIRQSFKHVTKDFVQETLTQLQHIRPGTWQLWASNEPYTSLHHKLSAKIAQPLNQGQILTATFNTDSLIKLDILVSRLPILDKELEQIGILQADKEMYAHLTPLRASNCGQANQLPHAIISCHWTIQAAVVNWGYNRKGHLPHIVAVTAEPLPARIAALALGTGDLDCVYHFALPELQATVQEAGNADSMELLKIMIEGRRLRDISDLPFDLAI